MEELTEVITAVEFHPEHCNTFLYSSSKGTIKIGDMRAAALCDQHAKGNIKLLYIILYIQHKVLYIYICINNIFNNYYKYLMLIIKFSNNFNFFFFIYFILIFIK